MSEFKFLQGQDTTNGYTCLYLEWPATHCLWFSDVNEKVVPFLTFSAHLNAFTKRMESFSHQALPLWLGVATVGVLTRLLFFFWLFVAIEVVVGTRERWSACKSESSKSSSTDQMSHWLIAMALWRKMCIIYMRDVAHSFLSLHNAVFIHQYLSFDKFSLLPQESSA